MVSGTFGKVPTRRSNPSFWPLTKVRVYKFHVVPICNYLQMLFLSIRRLLISGRILRTPVTLTVCSGASK